MGAEVGVYFEMAAALEHHSGPEGADGYSACCREVTGELLQWEK